jgi:hypothetical protein
MPSTRRWSVPPKRIAATAVLGVIGIFLICGSVGLGAWLVAAIGIAVVAIGAGIFVVTAVNSRSTSEIEGTAHVAAISAPPSGVTHGRCRLNLVLYSKGISGVGVRIRDDRVPVAKWPDVGADLPVMITIDKPQRTRVLWDEVATHRESAEERARGREADERAAAMAADDSAYADLDAALDNVDVADPSDVADTPAPEPPRFESPSYEPPSYEPDVDEPAIDEPAMATTGTRTIEMDLMDPSLMFWTGPPSPRRPDGSRPSPYRRRRSDRGAAVDLPTDEPPPRIEDAWLPTDVEPAPSHADAIEADPIEADPIEADPIEADPIEADAIEADPIEADPVEADPAEADPVEADPVDVDPVEADRAVAADAIAIDPAVLVDNGQIVDFDVFDGGPPIADSGSSPRPALPEWPPRSAAAVAAAAALPHQWDDDGRDDIADEPAEDLSNVAAIDDGSAGDVSNPNARRVPRNRAASADEVFDQDTADDGPGYIPDTAFADDAGYDPDAGYSSDAGYSEPGRPDTAE